jgi:acyl-CoA reductase-like NAD-dependent aldehyde dehydrogenase
VVVDFDANLKIAAWRIIWGKTLHAGQSCVAPDFLLVHKKVKDELLELMKNCILEFFSENPETSSDYSRIVNEKAVLRLAQLIQNETVYFGGDWNTGNRYFSPTIITNVDFESGLMKEEIFGPILPVIDFENMDEVFLKLNSMEKPLAAYYFSDNKKKQNEFIQRTMSGDVAINDTVLHFSNLNLPFGGVGNSGMGAYHGKRSFDVFSYERSVFKTPVFFDNPFRYAPYKKWVIKILSFLMK